MKGLGPVPLVTMPSYFVALTGGRACYADSPMSDGAMASKYAPHTPRLFKRFARMR